MLSCDSFRDRLYDEDARAALLGRTPIPADLLAHRDACAACGQEWDEAGADLVGLPSLLAVPAPVAVVRKIRIGAAERLQPAPSLDWREGVAWAAIGAGVCAPAAAWVPMPGPVALGMVVLGMVGASIAFGACATRRVLREALR